MAYNNFLFTPSLLTVNVMLEKIYRKLNKRIYYRRAITSFLLIFTTLAEFIMFSPPPPTLVGVMTSYSRMCLANKEFMFVKTV